MLRHIYLCKTNSGWTTSKMVFATHRLSGLYESNYAYIGVGYLWKRIGKVRMLYV